MKFISNLSCFFEHKTNEIWQLMHVVFSRDVKRKTKLQTRPPYSMIQTNIKIIFESLNYDVELYLDLLHK